MYAAWHIALSPVQGAWVSPGAPLCLKEGPALYVIHILHQASSDGDDYIKNQQIWF